MTDIKNPRGQSRTANRAASAEPASVPASLMRALLRHFRPLVRLKYLEPVVSIVTSTTTPTIHVYATVGPNFDMEGHDKSQRKWALVERDYLQEPVMRGPLTLSLELHFRHPGSKPLSRKAHQITLE